MTNTLGVTTLARLDLAVDDFTGNFDFDYAKTAFFDGAFRTALRGNYPKMRPIHEFDINRNENITGITVGSRTSRVFWRIYDKKQEQQIKLGLLVSNKIFILETLQSKRPNRENFMYLSPVR